MKLYRTLSLFVIGLSTAGLAALSAQGCSSSDATAPATAAGTVPPSPVTGAPASNTPGRTFALNQLYLGETNRSGVAVKDAWKDYGYNLDGLITAKADTNVCTRDPLADSSKQEDGNGGIDNAFGRSVLSYIVGLLPGPSKTLNDSIASGAFTIMLDINGLTDDAKQTNNGLTGRLLVGGDYGTGKMPTFLPTDNWPYIADPIVPISGAYINNGVFVNGTGGATVQLSLLIGGQPLALTINKAIITFTHSPPNDITNGTIAGVVNTQALVDGIGKIAGRLSASLCGGDAVMTVQDTIRQASDILDDGTNRAGVPCNAISIGLGFTGKRITEPSVVATPAPTKPDPCADAGADAAVDSSTDAGVDSGDGGDAG